MLPILLSNAIIEPEAIYTRSSGGKVYVIFKNQSKEIKLEVSEGTSEEQAMKRVIAMYKLGSMKIDAEFADMRLIANAWESVGSDESSDPTVPEPEPEATNQPKQ